MTTTYSQSPLLRKLESVARLTDEEREAVCSLPVQEQNIPAHQDIVREGDRPNKSFYIYDGLTCVYKTTGAGRRQIAAIHIAGDAPDLQSLHLPVLDISIATLTNCTVGFMKHEDIRALCRRRPRIADLLWRETLVDAAVYREWLTSAGQRDAFSRVGHIICEMFARYEAVGLLRKVDGKPVIHWPITQVQLGDALGLSSVHINRSLQALREQGFIAWKSGMLTGLDLPRLKAASDFDPTYLHLSPPV